MHVFLGITEAETMSPVMMAIRQVYYTVFVVALPNRLRGPCHVVRLLTISKAATI